MSTIGAAFSLTILYFDEVWSIIKQSIYSVHLLWSSDFEVFLGHVNPSSQIIHLYLRFSTSPFVPPSLLPFGWALNSIHFTGLLLNAGRLLLAILFFGSYLLVPIWPLILTVYARVIESDKPVFTVVGAGIGGFASAVSALLK